MKRELSSILNFDMIERSEEIALDYLVRESIVIQNTGWKSSLVQKIKRMTIFSINLLLIILISVVL